MIIETKEVVETKELTFEELKDLFSDLHLGDRKVALVAPPINPKTEGGLIKTPNQIQSEEDQFVENGAVILKTGHMTDPEEHRHIKVGRYAYVSIHHTSAEYVMEREGYRFVVLDAYSIPITREQKDEEEN